MKKNLTRHPLLSPLLACGLTVAKLAVAVPPNAAAPLLALAVILGWFCPAIAEKLLR